MAERTASLSLGKFVEDRVVLTELIKVLEQPGMLLRQHRRLLRIHVGEKLVDGRPLLGLCFHTQPRRDSVSAAQGLGFWV